jgi:hypothetical protein
MSNMKATSLVQTRLIYAENAFAELVLWQLPKPLPGSIHPFKYRLAYVVDGVCVIRYDNEADKGDHRHFGKRESKYLFTTPENLLSDFQQEIRRHQRENNHP